MFLNSLLPKACHHSPSPSGAIVAHLRTTDPDTDDQSTFQYSVTDPGTFAINGQMLITRVKLNYEMQNRYDIHITVTDENGLHFTKVTGWEKG